VNVKVCNICIASGMSFLIASFDIFALPPTDSESRTTLSPRSDISLENVRRVMIPAALSSSIFHVRTHRAFKSIDSLSTVGMTDGADRCTPNPVVWCVGNPINTRPPFFPGSTVAKTSTLLASVSLLEFVLDLEFCVRNASCQLLTSKELPTL
jgi:hypothetical protein